MYIRLKNVTKKSNRIFCWITYPLSSGVEKSTDYRERTAVGKRCSRITGKERQWENDAHESGLRADHIV